MPPVVLVLPLIGALEIPLAGIIFSLATSVLLPLVQNVLFGKPEVPGAPKPSLSTTVRGATETRKVIVGEVLTGGVLVYAETGDSTNAKTNGTLHCVVALAGHECDSISDVYLDDKKSDNPVFFADNSGLPLVHVFKHLGSPNQTVDVELQSRLPQWDSTHRLRGICYVYVNLDWQVSPVTFRAGIPNIRALTKGAKCYDPRTGQTVWTRNSALIVRYWITSSDGFNADDDEVDDDLISAAANICDETVDGQVRYTCDGVISLDERPLDVLENLLATMAGACVYSQGKFRIFAGAATSKSVTIDRSWLRDKIMIDPRIARQDLFNAVRGTFLNDQKDYQLADFPPIKNSTYAAQDGETLYRDISLKYVRDAQTAKRPQRIAKIHLEKSRQGIKATIPCNFKALGVRAWDVIGITEELLGWSDKEFRVLQWTLAEGGGIDLVVQEEAAASYNWANGSATSIDPSPDTNLNDPFQIDPPGTPMVTESLIETRQGAGVASVATVTWGESPDAFAFRYKVQYKLHASSTWLTAGETEETQFQIQDLGAGNYDFRVAARNQFGTLSAWSTTTKQLKGLTAPPTVVSGFNLIIRNGQAHLSWTRATDLDVLNGGFIKIRWAPATSGVVWGTSIDLVQLSGSANEAAVPAVTGTYLARFVDSTGNISTADAAVVTTLPDVLAMNVVQTATESTAFSGSKTNTVKVGSVLQLDGASVEGFYAFNSGSVDLGAVVGSSRVTVNIVVSVFDVGDTIDSRLTNIDTWSNIDGSATGTEATAEVQVRVTNDDPAGSPTWSGWMPFVAADFTCRAFQFRLRLTTTDISFNIAVSTLSVTIDMPDRTVPFDVTTSAVGDTTVPFSPPFMAVPAVGLTIQNETAGDTVQEVSRTAGSYVFAIRNAGNRVARNVSGIARKY